MFSDPPEYFIYKHGLCGCGGPASPPPHHLPAHFQRRHRHPPPSLPPSLMPTYLPTHLPTHLHIYLPTYLPTYLPKVLEGISQLNCWLNVNCLPTTSKPYNALPPWSGGIAGRPDIRVDVSMAKRFQFLGNPGKTYIDRLPPSYPPSLPPSPSSVRGRSVRG